MASTSRATSYDEVPYADDPYPSSHPGHLATVATLSGLSPAPVERCRALELGCSRGGNLIPMAVGLPGSRFVGIDSSPGQVAAARAVIDALGLENITVEARDVLDVDEEFGTFDYIICHGTYSWVADDVRDKILEVCSRNLAPRGVAYVSYNTYPGWRLRGLVRELMCYHTRRFDRPEDRAAQARALLDFMARSAAPIDRTYGALLAEESEYIRQRPDSYLLHDHLEEVNDPVYFHEFVGRAAAKGLRFVSEVQSNVVALEGLPSPVADGLRRLASDDVELEQFLDFLINRRFRQSVLCHAALTPRRHAQPEDLAKLEVAAPRSDRPLPVPMRNEGLLRGALAHLAAAWPFGVPWGSLPRLARTPIGPAPGAGAAASESRDEQDLAADLICCYNLKLVEFRTHKPPYVAEISDRPLASPLARHQAATGNIVTNLRHEAGQLNDFSRIVLRHLDGTHDRSAILRALHQARNEGRLFLSSDSLSPGDVAPGVDREEPLERLFGSMLDGCLERLARFALLMS